MKGFNEALEDLVAKAKPSSIHEVGCGEGHWVLEWASQNFVTRGSDFSEKVIDLARENALLYGVDPSIFKVRNIYELERGEDDADLIVCSEVLEHLANPSAALASLQKIVPKHIILTVPREPIWRTMNMARGTYLKDFGNTPGHIQHWSSTKFTRMVQQYFDVVDVRKPLPWTMLLCKARA